MMFNTLGVMLDCTRNAVMSVEALKEYMLLLKKMGYNHVQLYTEDTYEVEGEELFGYNRGRYSMAELKELDDFAYGIGIELVPCIQTLAHLNATLRWKKYENLMERDSILLVGDDKTYEFIEKLISSVRKCFRTDKIHIGMDEAHNLGKGRYRDIHGDTDRTEILMYHLKRVCEITDKYNFKPMIWSDMFYRIANGGEYYGKNIKFNPEIKKTIPEQLTLVYWDYYHTDKATYSAMASGHRQLTDKVIFAGGAWKWSGHAPHNEFAIRTVKAAFPAMIENDIKDVFLTCWGDNGAEASEYSILPTLVYAACFAQGITKLDDIKAKFYEWVGASYDDFMMLDLPDRIEKSNRIVNPSKYGMYNDCFMGLFDNTFNEEDGKKYASFARRLAGAAKRNPKYAWLFDSQAKLCAFMAYKANIGNRTREAYQSGDKALLEELIKDYKKMIKKCEEFYYSFRNRWYTENKPHGFDVQDIRIGGLIMRMKSCLDRLCDRKDGKIEKIPELEEAVVHMYNGRQEFNSWQKTVSTNFI